MPEKERIHQVVGSRIDEVIAGVFFSKRYTGQFNDFDEMSELDLDIHLPEVSGQNTRVKNRWSDGIVHDFEETDDTTTYPPDQDEAAK